MRALAVLAGTLLVSASIAADNGAGSPGGHAQPKGGAPTWAEYEEWLTDVAEKWVAPRIVVGGKQPNPVRLDRKNGRGPRAGWSPDEWYWTIKVEQAGRYEVKVLAPGAFETFDVFVRRGDETQFAGGGPIIAGARTIRYKDEASLEVELEAGKAELTATVTLLKKTRSAQSVEVTYLGPADK